MDKKKFESLYSYTNIFSLLRTRIHSQIPTQTPTLSYTRIYFLTGLLVYKDNLVTILIQILSYQSGVPMLV